MSDHFSHRGQMTLDLFSRMILLCVLSDARMSCAAHRVLNDTETKHERTFKDIADKAKVIKKAVSRYEKQSNVFKSLSVAKTMKLKPGTNWLCVLLSMESLLLMGIL